ncbi:MAG: hypothetical protein ACLFOY_12670 [Desulfatibacillaceae bacterium]
MIITDRLIRRVTRNPKPAVLVMGGPDRPARRPVAIEKPGGCPDPAPNAHAWQLDAPARPGKNWVVIPFAVWAAKWLTYEVTNV